MAGIFGLGEVRTEQVNNTWPEDPNFGYFANGRIIGTPSVISNIERLDFSNETTSLPGNASSVDSYGRAAVLSSEYGYFAGGYLPGASPDMTSTMDRLDFSNDTTSVPAPTLVYKRHQLAGVSTPQYGYFGGGGPTPSTICVIQRLDLSNETTSNPPASLPSVRYNLAGVPTPQYGYFAGGSYVNIIYRMDFSTELTSTLPATLPEKRGGLSAVSNETHAYFAGGVNIDDGVQYLCTIDRLEFSTETATALGDSLNTQAQSPSEGVSNRLYGYFGGHLSPPVPSAISNIQRLDFSSETMNVLSDVLNIAAYDSAGTPSGTSGKNGSHARKISGTDADGKPISSTYGYFIGGNNGSSQVSTINRLDYSTQTVATPTDNKLTSVRQRLVTSSNSNYGYIVGGTTLNPSPPPVLLFLCTIDRLDFSTETTSNPPARSRRFIEATTSFSNSNYGYFGGGYAPTLPGITDVIDRFDFSNETTSTPGNNLPEGRYYLTAVSNNSFGYFAGGFAAGPTIVNTIDRIDLSTETTSNPSGNNLTLLRYGLKSVSSSNYGYFAGGVTSGPSITNVIDRLDFSNETAGVPTTNNDLQESRSQLAAVSNNSFGYFAGGINPSTSNLMDRLEFSTETTSLLSATLPQGRSELGAVSN